MKPILVDHPSKLEKDPDNLPWLRRLKYVEVGEILAEYEAANAMDARTDCPITAYLTEHQADDVVDVTEHIYAHHEWGPAALTIGLWSTLRFNHAASHPHGEAIAEWIQHYYCLQLRKHHSFEWARPAVAACLYHPRMRWVSTDAAYVMLAYINEGHPNPGRWLAKPAIREKFPMLTDEQIARFPAPDFS